MVRYMADSINWIGYDPHTPIYVPNVGTVPVDLSAGYAANSHYHDSSQAKGPTNVIIDVTGSLPASDVLDIEIGDATPNTAPGWVRAHNALNTGFPAILYCNRTTVHSVANALEAAGLNNPGKDFYWWIATLDGTDSLADMTGVVAIQAWSASFFPGKNIDLSKVFVDSWKAPPPPPTPIPIPVPIPVSEADSVFMVHIPDNGDVFVVGEFSYRHVPDIPTYAYLQEFYPVREVTRDGWNAASAEIDARRAAFIASLKA